MCKLRTIHCATLNLASLQKKCRFWCHLVVFGERESASIARGRCNRRPALLHSIIFRDGGHRMRESARSRWMRFIGQSRSKGTRPFWNFSEFVLTVHFCLPEPNIMLQPILLDVVRIMAFTISRSTSEPLRTVSHFQLAIFPAKFLTTRFLFRLCFMQKWVTTGMMMWVSISVFGSNQ